MARHLWAPKCHNHVLLEYSISDEAFWKGFALDFGPWLKGFASLATTALVTSDTDVGEEAWGGSNLSQKHNGVEVRDIVLLEHV